MTLTLLRRERLAERTTAFHFETPGFQFKAGQTLDLTLINPSETDAEGNTRTFSIASAAGRGSRCRDPNPSERVQVPYSRRCRSAPRCKQTAPWGHLPFTATPRNRLSFLPVDSTEASTRVLEYLRRVFGRWRGLRFCLAYLLPRLPPEVLESGEAEGADEERRVLSWIEFEPQPFH
jgi:hypothetical protein